MAKVGATFTMFGDCHPHGWLCGRTAHHKYLQPTWHSIMLIFFLPRTQCWLDSIVQIIQWYTLCVQSDFDRISHNLVNWAYIYGLINIERMCGCSGCTSCPHAQQCPPTNNAHVHTKERAETEMHVHVFGPSHFKCWRAMTFMETCFPAIPQFSAKASHHL